MSYIGLSDCPIPDDTWFNTAIAPTEFRMMVFLGLVPQANGLAIDDYPPLCLGQ